jgi:hypothetical protein
MEVYLNAIRDVARPPLPPAVHRLHAGHDSAVSQLDDVRVGDLQAWYYQQDRTIVLWNCVLLNLSREADPALDANLVAFWTGSEAHLSRRFLDATRIVTPSWESVYDTRDYRGFLQAMGFARLSAKAYAKALQPYNLPPSSSDGLPSG